MKLHGLGLVLLSLLSPLSFAKYESETPFFDHLENLAKANPNQDITSFLKSLPSEWREKYTLVYDTQSIQSASLESPRVIAFDPNYRLIYSFSELKDRSGKQSIEAIETYGGKPLQFIKIVFPERNQAGNIRVERNPKACIGCHQMDSKSGELGFIFEPYPNWPGMYGSSHNSRMYGVSQSGTGFLYRPEFEIKALEDFKARDFSSGVYSALLNVDKINYDSLAETNTFLGNALFTHQTHRIQEYMIKSFSEFSQFQSYVFAGRYHNSDSWNQPSAPGFNNQRNPYSTALGRDVYYERPIYNRLLNLLEQQSTDRLTRVKEIYAKFGTNKDIEDINRTKVFIPKSGDFLLPTGQMPSGPMFVAHQFVDFGSPLTGNLTPHLLLDIWKTKNPEATIKVAFDLKRTWSSLNDGVTDGTFFLSSDMESALKNCRSIDELITRIPYAFFRFSSKEFSQNPAMGLIRQEWENDLIAVAKKWNIQERVAAFEKSGAIGFSESFYENLAK